MRERVRLAQVFAVTRRILSNQYQLLHALLSQLMCFSDDRSKSPAAKMAAHLWDKAKGARTIAALRDLDERIMARCGQYTWRRFIVEIGGALIAEGNDGKRTRIRLRI